MSCPIDTIFDKQTNGLIDNGVDYMTNRIKTVMTAGTTGNCLSTNVDDGVVIFNMIIQYIVLCFVILALTKQGESENIVKAIVWISYISSFLIFVQYRSVFATAWKLFMNGLDIENKLVILMSVFITLLTTYIKKGNLEMKITLAVTIFIVIRLGFQLKNFMLDQESTIPVFLSFVENLFSPDRISKIFNAFKI